MLVRQLHSFILLKVSFLHSLNPSNPFSPVECMLIAGNVSVPPMMRLNQSSSHCEIHGLHGLPDHPFEDSRICDLCLQRGDSIESGRMLCTLTGEWVI